MTRLYLSLAHLNTWLLCHYFKGFQTIGDAQVSGGLTLCLVEFGLRFSIFLERLFDSWIPKDPSLELLHFQPPKLIKTQYNLANSALQLALWKKQFVQFTDIRRCTDAFFNKKKLTSILKDTHDITDTPSPYHTVYPFNCHCFFYFFSSLHLSLQYFHITPSIFLLLLYTHFTYFFFLLWKITVKLPPLPIPSLHFFAPGVLDFVEFLFSNHSCWSTRCTIITTRHCI